MRRFSIEIVSQWLGPWRPRTFCVRGVWLLLLLALPVALRAQCEPGGGYLQVGYTGTPSTYLGPSSICQVMELAQGQKLVMVDLEQRYAR